MKQKETEQYSDEEAERRFHALVRGAMNTKPKPLKEIVGTTDRAKAIARRRRVKGIQK